MSIEILMPALSPTMETGNLTKWLVKEGDKISSGDVIAEIETDKATMEVESVDNGFITKLLTNEGTNDIPVGQAIALLTEEGEIINTAPKKTALEPIMTPPTTPNVTKDRRRVSPLAKRRAKELAIDITAITGTGPKGRIIKRDVEAAISDNKTQEIKSPAIAPPPIPAISEQLAHDGVPFKAVELSNMRKTIAKRLTLSKTTVPHFYLTIDCQIDELLEQRKLLNKILADQGGKLSVNDFIIRAAGLALKQVPAANVQFSGDKIYQYERADISVAVAIEGGLITPVVQGACSKGLGQISNDMKDMAARAREGRLLPEEYNGGTFSISNLGMHGIKEFGAIINPPQAAILAIGAGEQRPVIKDGAIEVGTVMTCTLSCDHRAIDGAVAAEFLAAFKSYMENPLSMLL